MKTKTGICVSCEQEKIVHKDRKSGLLWCPACKERENYSLRRGWKKCVCCGEFKKLAIANPPTCYSCREEPSAICGKCGLEKKGVYAYKSYGIKVCSGCRSQLRREDTSTHEWCIYCPDDAGKKPVAVRDEDGLAVCHEHWRHHRNLHPNPKKKEG